MKDPPEKIARGPMDATLAVIGQEHHAFDAALAIIVDRSSGVRRGSRPDFAAFGRNISYLSTFMDHFHHPKEDDYLFKAVRKRSPDGRDLIADLQRDHARSPHAFAELMHSLAGSGPVTAARFETFAGLMERYAYAQLEHMRRENEEFVPLARRVLQLADWQEMEAAFAANRDPFFTATAESGLDFGPPKG